MYIKLILVICWEKDTNQWKNNSSGVKGIEEIVE